MARKTNKRRPPQPMADGRASGPAQQVPGPYARLAVCALLLLAVIAVFGQTAGHDFVNYDDDDYVYENWHVRQGLTAAGIAWAATAYDAANWHPLTWISHMLDCQLYELRPGGHHLTNLLLHAAAAVLLFLTLRRMTQALWPSAWVAAVFALHPLRVESVAWVAERKDVLSGLLFMLTLWLYAGYAQHPASWGRYLLVVASFALGLAAKPMLVTLPFVLLLLDYWPLGRWQGAGRKTGVACLQPGVAGLGMVGERAGHPRSGSGSREPGAVNHKTHETYKTYETYIPPLRLLLEKIPFFVLAAVSCAVTLAAQRGAMQTLRQLAFPWRVANAVVAYVAYLGKMFCPAGLAVLYPLPKDRPPAWEVAAAAALLSAISAAVFMARRKRPYLLAGWLWYLATLAPVIGLIQVGSQAMADRYTYLTQIGLYIAIVWGARSLISHRSSRRLEQSDIPHLSSSVSALLLAVLLACAWQQTSYWPNSERLWTRALACTSNNSVAHNNLGNALFRRGQVDKALAHYQQALAIDPNYARAHGNLGMALAESSQPKAAIAHLRRALEIDDRYADIHSNLGRVLAESGKIDEAIDEYRKALDINPYFESTYNNLGLAFAGRRQIEEAIGYYRKALELNPDFAEANFNLGIALAGHGEVDEAIALLQKVVKIRPDFAAAHAHLAEALAGRGQVDQALTHYRKALGLALAQNDRALADFVRARIGRFQPAAPGP